MFICPSSKIYVTYSVIPSTTLFSLFLHKFPDGLQHPILSTTDSAVNSSAILWYEYLLLRQQLLVICPSSHVQQRGTMHGSSSGTPCLGYPCLAVQPFVPASGKSAPVVLEQDSSALIPVGHALQQPARMGQQNKNKRDFKCLLRVSPFSATAITADATPRTAFPLPVPLFLDVRDSSFQACQFSDFVSKWRNRRDTSTTWLNILLDIFERI